MEVKINGFKWNKLWINGAWVLLVVFSLFLVNFYSTSHLDRAEIDEFPFTVVNIENEDSFMSVGRIRHYVVETSSGKTVKITPKELVDHGLSGLLSIGDNIDNWGDETDRFFVLLYKRLLV